MRSGSSIQIRVLEAREVPTEAVRLENGIMAPLSDHPAVVVDLDLSACAPCAPSSVANAGTRAHATARPSVEAGPDRPANAR